MQSKKDLISILLEMPRRNRIDTVKVPMSLDSTLDGVLEKLAERGVFGKNKAEVACAILWNWVWANEGQLGRQGIRLNAAKRSERGKAGGR